MAEIKVPYVQNRNRGFRYRRVIPADIRGQFEDRQNWTKAWRRGTPLAVIESESQQLAIKHDNMIAVARGEKTETEAREILAGDPTDVHYVLAMFAEHRELFGKLTPEQESLIEALNHGGRLPMKSPLLSVALAQDVERYGQDRDNYPVESTVASFISVISDQPVTSISRQSAMAWIDSLKNADGTPYAPATLRKRVGNMRGLLNRAFLDLEYSGLNPFAKHRLKGNGSVTDRLPFNKAMLAAIDSHLANSTRLKAETKQVLRIMRNTGASPKEIGGLVLADVSLDGKIPYMWVRVNAQRGIKSPARDRQIPLVGVSLEAMKDAVKRAEGDGKSPDTVKLFTGFGGKTGQDAKLISKNVNKAVHAAGIQKSKRLSAYSYRHTLAEAMRSAGIPQHIHDRIMGHTAPGIAGRYGSPRARLSEARDALERALEHLGDVDPSIYSERERIKG